MTVAGSTEIQQVDLHQHAMDRRRFRKSFGFMSTLQRSCPLGNPFLGMSEQAFEFVELRHRVFGIDIPADHPYFEP